ncbi:serine protease [Winogradskya humida]|uniref:Serine protease n=1 Tax=Winogradskya humida TaxID=113566 RepID=A0ABQ3ZX30_9ACTN|nr:serine protease [Actinoplanes humidus]
MKSFHLGLAGVTALAAALVVPAGPADATTPATAPASEPVGGYTVTLVTGDRVTVGSRAATRAFVERGAGRGKVSFAQTVVGGHLMVIPSDAARLVQTQRVDRRLFDVTGLIEGGYDDRAHAGVPLILGSETATNFSAVRKAVGSHATREMTSLRALAVSAPKSSSMWRAVTKSDHVWLDGRRKLSLDASVPQIGAPAAWQAGLTGAGMKVAVLDSGVDATHPDLAGRVEEKNFTTAPGGDQVGHGTHVASTIAGSGTASNGKYRGVAPDATILSGKVCGDQFCEDSAILAGMQWAAVEQHARVVNLSLGGPDFDGDDPLEEAVNTLSASTGALFVIAAGNEGPSASTVGSPGSADAALTVAAVDKSDVTAEFSSRGPRVGDAAIKPDIAAPGVDIVAARAAGTSIGEPAADFPDTYMTLSGTSMATPHVAGAAALLAQAHPEWDGARLKGTLIASSARTGDGRAFEQGAGRVDVARAITQVMTAEPVSVSFGLQKWPHEDDAVVSKQVTYRNGGTVDLTLALALTSGQAFTLDRQTVTVPAGGTAAVTVTADTRALPVGDYTADIVATAGTQRVMTAVAVQKEPERYALTLHHLGLDGKPVINYLTGIFQVAGDYFALPWDPSGTVTLRLAPGRYTVGTYLDESAAQDGSQQAMIYQPVLDLTGDTSITFDAREATPVKVSVPDASAAAVESWIGTEQQTDEGTVIFGTLQPGIENLRVRQLGPQLPGTATVLSTWARSGSGPRGTDSPYAYFVGERVPVAQVLNGYDRAYRRTELAAEKQVFHGGSVVQQWAQLSDAQGEVYGVGIARARPGASRVNYLSTGNGARWQTDTRLGVSFDEYGFLQGLDLNGSYRSGASTVEHWGAAPLQTRFSSRYEWVGREGDILYAQLPPLTDAAGHPGYSQLLDSVSTRLYRGQELLGESDWLYVDAAGLPDGDAVYRVVQETTGGFGGLSTRTSTEFTFTSGAGAQGLVPVFTVNVAPALDASGAVRAGSVGQVPLVARDQKGSLVQGAALGLEVSFDDGATWRASGPAVHYPRGKGYVSVRVHGKNKAGTSVSQTVIRAYRYR